MEELIVYVVHIAHIEFPVLWLKRGYFIVNYFKFVTILFFFGWNSCCVPYQKTSVVANCKRGVEVRCGQLAIMQIKMFCYLLQHMSHSDTSPTSHVTTYNVLN